MTTEYHSSPTITPYLSRLNYSSMAEEMMNPRPQQSDEKSKPQIISIELTRYKSLLEALGDPKKVFRMILTISAIGVLLFAGITLVVISIKRIYPYSDITTNAFGATTIKNEKSEVSYWLLNTAELWSNSGIKVKKGQTIKITASGRKHTAVHHLVDDALLNKPGLTEPWVGTDGFPEQRSDNFDRDNARAKYRIFPGENQDALLVQVVPFRGRFNHPQDRPIGKTPNQFRLVGRENEIHIDEDGVLFFAINDIVLDDSTVVKMMTEMADSKFRSDSLNNNDVIKNRVKSLQTIRNNFQSKDRDSVYTDFLKLFGFNSNADIPLNDKGKFGECGFGKNKGTQWIELFGYCMNNYKEPWFEDNVGSFLILVETVTD